MISDLFKVYPNLLCEWRNPLTAGLKSRCCHLGSVDTVTTGRIGLTAAGWCGACGKFVIETKAQVVPLIQLLVDWDLLLPRAVGHKKDRHPNQSLILLMLFTWAD